MISYVTVDWPDITRRVIAAYGSARAAAPHVGCTAPMLGFWLHGKGRPHARYHAALLELAELPAAARIPKGCARVDLLAPSDDDGREESVAACRRVIAILEEAPPDAADKVAVRRAWRRVAKCVSGWHTPRRTVHEFRHMPDVADEIKRLARRSGNVVEGLCTDPLPEHWQDALWLLGALVDNMAIADRVRAADEWVA